MSQEVGFNIAEIAMHEAGHAVACHRLFPDRLSWILTIEPNEYSFGRIESEYWEFSIDGDLEVAEQYFLDDAVFACAGYGAMKAAGYTDERAQWGCEPDFERAGHRLERAKTKAVALMALPDNIRAVDRLAKELMRHRTLDGDHMGIVIDVSDGGTTEAELAEYLQIREIFNSKWRDD